MSTRTLSQNHMALAAELIDRVRQQYPEENAQPRKIFGGLCHSFPIMVLNCGLCQALAFSEDKAAGTGKARNEAHRLLLDHVAALLGADSRTSMMDQVRTEDVTQYMVDTRRVLAAWVYWKRFAVSVLKVDSARQAEEEADV